MGLGNHLLRIEDAGPDHDAAREKLLCKFADFRALFKDGLRGLIRSGYLLFGIVAEPKELRALPPHEEGGFGEIGLAGDWHGMWRRFN